jgi:hypothetical protein
MHPYRLAHLYLTLLNAILLIYGPMKKNESDRTPGGRGRVLMVMSSGPERTSSPSLVETLCRVWTSALVYVYLLFK